MKIKKFENSIFAEMTSAPKMTEIETEIYDHLKEKMEEDCGEGSNVLTKMDKFNHSWLVDELIQFISKNLPASYTLLKFSKKYNYNELNHTLKNLFPREYSDAENIMNHNEEHHTIVNFSDMGKNLSAEYHVNKKHGKSPYKKENGILIPIEYGKTIPQDVIYLSSDLIEKYNEITNKIKELELEQKDLFEIIKKEKPYKHSEGYTPEGLL